MFDNKEDVNESPPSTPEGYGQQGSMFEMFSKNY